jgi:hypothetical protein
MIGKFRVNSDYFPKEESKMAYTYNRTTGAAKRHLQPRYMSREMGEFALGEETDGRGLTS